MIGAISEQYNVVWPWQWNFITSSDYGWLADKVAVL